MKEIWIQRRTSGVNVAPGKPASQIPDTHGDIKASSAVNENITDLQHSVPCANLNFKRHGQYFFFWDAKLRGSYFISGIRVYHKDKGAREKLYGLTIVTFYQNWETVFADNETHLSRCTDYHERKDKPLVCQDIIDVALEPPVQADFVRLRSKHNVTLCDVEIVAVACTHPFVTNGNTNATDKSYTGTNILLQCVSGYIASTPTSVCTSRGTWHPKPVCANGNTKRICADHQVLTRFNSSVCKNGYELRDSAERTCLENGSWSGTTPNCEKIRCTNQTILKDLYQNTKELLFGDEFIAVYNSEQFYLVNGSSDVVCAANGSLRWAAQQPYLASICIVQKNGHFWAKTRDCLGDDKCEVGETITFECREDFQMMQINATCLSNYTWSSAPICTPLSLLKSTGAIIGGSAAVGVVGIPSVIAFLLFLCKRRLQKGKSKTLHEKPDEPTEDLRVYLETNATHKTDRKNGEDPELSSSDTYLTPVVTDNNYYESVFVYESIE